MEFHEKFNGPFKRAGIKKLAMQGFEGSYSAELVPARIFISVLLRMYKFPSPERKLWHVIFYYKRNIPKLALSAEHCMTEIIVITHGARSMHKRRDSSYS